MLRLVRIIHGTPKAVLFSIGTYSRTPGSLLAQLSRSSLLSHPEVPFLVRFLTFNIFHASTRGYVTPYTKCALLTSPFIFISRLNLFLKSYVKIQKNEQNSYRRILLYFIRF